MDYSTLGVYVRDYAFAAYGTNTGHYGNSANGTFALNNVRRARTNAD